MPLLYIVTITYHPSQQSLPSCCSQTLINTTLISRSFQIMQPRDTQEAEQKLGECPDQIGPLGIVFFINQDSSTHCGQYCSQARGPGSFRSLS